MRKRPLAAAPSPDSEGAAALSSEPAAYVNAVWLGSKVALFWRDADGELRKREVPAESCCHLRLADWTSELERECRSSRALRGFRIEGNWVRLTFVDRDAARNLCGPRGWFDLKSIPTFEADLHPVRRWFVEHPDVKIQKPRRCYFDIETDSRVPFDRKEEARILIWAICDHDTGDVIQGVLEDDTDAAEEELLGALFSELMAYDQVCVWAGGVKGHGIFDIDVLHARLERYRAALRVTMSRWLWLSHLDAYAKMNMSAAGSGEEKQSMALGRVLESLGLEGKDDFDASKMWEAWLEAGDELKRACKYNARDVVGMRDIELKKPYLDALVAACSICGVFCDQRGINGTAYVESFLLRLAQGRDLHFPSHWGYKEYERFEGAFVLEPTRLGLLRDVHVCDFAALYPSIIQSWNLSPETHAPEHKLLKEAARPTYLAHVAPVVQPLPPGHARCPNTGETFRISPEGLLAIAVTQMRAIRAFYTKKMKEFAPGTPEWTDAKNLADGIKIIVNTFYGVVGSVFSRFFKREVAEGTSTTGAWLIKHVMKEAEARSMHVVSGDTDSAFVTDASQESFKAFVDWLNAARLPELVASQGCVRNEISLEAEKGFGILVYVSKKHYCNPPEAPIWTGSGFKPLGEVRVGDEVAGWTEGTGRNQRRRLTRTCVVAVHSHVAPIVRVTMESGRVFRCTADHRWLRFDWQVERYKWQVPKVGARLAHVVEVPRELNVEERVEAAWLGGIFDGEGSLSGGGRDQIAIAQSVRCNPEVCVRIERAFEMLGLRYSIYKTRSAEGVYNYVVLGGRQARINFLAWCKPAKASRFPDAALGSSFAKEDVVVSVEPDGEGEVIGLTTETGNYVAWGFASKNCGRFSYYKGQPATADSKPEVKGLEYKRGDAVRLARQFQMEVCEKLLCMDTFPIPAVLPYVAADFKPMVERWRDHVTKDSLELRDYMKSQRLTRPLKSYVAKKKADGEDASLNAHVEIAKRMLAAGMDVREGTRIEYVVVDGFSSPQKAVPLHEFAPGMEDRHYLWEKQVWPPTFRVLEVCFPEVDWKVYNRSRPYQGKSPKHGGAGAGQTALPGVAEDLPPVAPQRSAVSSSPVLRRVVDELE